MGTVYKEGLGLTASQGSGQEEGGDRWKTEKNISVESSTAPNWSKQQKSRSPSTLWTHYKLKQLCESV